MIQKAVFLICLVSVLSIDGIAQSPANSDSKTKIIFEAIDNQARIYVNEEQIYDSGSLSGEGVLFIEVDLEKHLKKGSNLVTVWLLNSFCEDCLQNPWKIEYEIYEDDEIIYSQSKSSKGLRNRAGKVWSETYEMYVE